MKVLDLRSLGSLRSAEIEPGGSIHLSSGAQSPENGYWRRGSLVQLAGELRRRMESCCKRI